MKIRLCNEVFSIPKIGDIASRNVYYSEPITHFGNFHERIVVKFGFTNIKLKKVCEKLRDLKQRANKLGDVQNP